ncbi:MAG: AAA family ATPase [Leptospirales bacterium]|nr:AAA family ATPase [Leptospirales bacterium]
MAHVPVDSPQRTILAQRNGLQLLRVETDGGSELVRECIPGPRQSETEKRLREEYEFLQKLYAQLQLTPPRLVQGARGLSLILEDRGGTPLPPPGPGDNSLALDIVTGAAHALARLHSCGAVLSAMRPAAMLYNVVNGSIQFFDFSAATFLERRSPSPLLDLSRSDELAYMSPEESGRMSRSVDYRSDLYSLGAIFYHYLCGDAPFSVQDPLGLIHAHIARTPATPAERVGAAPALSAIAMRLLEKNPEDRYQSADGLLFDLLLCQQELENRGEEGLYHLQLAVGERDRSSRFSMPERLYGRSLQVAQIVQSFERTRAGRTETIFVSGRSGIGKSVLIQEAQAPIIAARGLFGDGKYDSYKRDVPYRGLVRAFQSLVRQILTGSADYVDYWRQRLLEALGDGGRAIIDVIPELSALIGPQPELAALSAQETQNRFHILFQRFIAAFGSRSYPSVIFLDDMQWADAASLRLLESALGNREIRHLLFILAYRDNEVDDSHPLSKLLESLRSSDAPLLEISLPPMTEADVAQLVQDTLRLPESRALGLATLIYNRTKGNPFFVGEVFRSLYQKRLLRYEGAGWVWNAEEVEQAHISANVAEFMIERIRLQSEVDQQVLKVAACVGAWFRRDVFLQIETNDPEQSSESLVRLANEGFLRLGKNDANFAHDKIREATYALIDSNERMRLHLLIARSYLAMLDQFRLEDHIFTVVTQLNQALPLLRDADEREQGLRLNHTAADRALAATAYDAALGYYKVAIDLLPEDAWLQRYTESLGLFSGKAAAEYLSKDYEAAESTFDVILRHARDAVDKAPIFELRASMYVSQNRMTEALQQLRESLRELEAPLPRRAGRWNLILELLRYWRRRGRRPITSLSAIGEMREVRARAAIRILNASLAAAYIGEPALFPLLVLKMVNLSLRYGAAPLTAFSYATFGVLQCAALGNYRAGERLGKLAIQTLERFGDRARAIECRVLFIHATMIAHWRTAAREQEPIFRRSIESGLANGDLQYTSYALNNMHFQMSLMRRNLEETLQSFRRHDDLFQSLKQYNAYQLYQLNKQFIQNLRGQASDLLLLQGDYFDERSALPEWLASSNANALFDYYLCKARLEYFFGDLTQADRYLRLALPLSGAMLGMMFIPELCFFQALIAARQAAKHRGWKRATLRRELARCVRQLQSWAANCPENYGHKAAIAHALLLQLQRRTRRARSKLYAAQRLARNNRFWLEEAIAHQLLAELCAAQEEKAYAVMHLQLAEGAFRTWGSRPLAVQAAATLARFIGENPESAGLSATDDALTDAGSAMDLEAVVRASQAISSEIQSDRLLDRLLQILFEIAGADRGALTLHDGERWRVAASSNRNDGALIFANAPLEETEELAVSIVRYVLRTEEVVLLADATREGLFVQDPYILSRQPRSVLCYPVLRHGKLVAAVYLENTLSAGAFNRGQMELLNVLTSQIAISLDNARLYTSLESQVEDRTAELRKALNEVRELKEQQDMDYFLNMLLIEPLSRSRASSANTSVDSMVRQKKRFMFRHRQWELGGDINITENMDLGGRPYIVFLNGDAMGKSIQGAGGVLVLGTVFKSMVQHTLSAEQDRDISPENWLQRCYFALHKAFESFEGSMLMSAVFGLLDDYTGSLYTINAMHPEIALYRDGRARYLFASQRLRKLGHDRPAAFPCIDVTPLRCGDAVFLGSDGRDEFSSGGDDKGDEGRSFLRCIEEQDGSLRGVFGSLLQNGDPSDDLSILRLGWRENMLDDLNQEVMKQTIAELESAIEADDYERTAEIGSVLLAAHPHLTRYLFPLSVALGKLEQFYDAVKEGERLLLREPEHIPNLLHLIEMSARAGRIARARALMADARNTYPGDAQLLALERRLWGG